MGVVIGVVVGITPLSKFLDPALQTLAR